MVPYFGRHGAKQYVQGKFIKFGYKMWVAPTCDGYCIQFKPYLGLGTDLDPSFGLGGSVVNALASILPPIEESNITSLWTIFSPIFHY